VFDMIVALQADVGESVEPRSLSSIVGHFSIRWIPEQIS